MSSTISLGDANSSFQAGTIHGSVNTTFQIHHPPQGTSQDQPPPAPARKEKEINFLKCLNTSPYRDRKDRNPNRFQGTCDWFVSHKCFQDWQKSKSSVMLWVSADPGCGKSVLAKYLVDFVLPTSKSRTVCYFFFKDDFEDQRNVASALSCILRQLFEQKRILLSDSILDRFDLGGEKFTSSFGELWETLIEAAEDKNAGEIICLLDAIDECEERGRSQLAQKLCHLYSTKGNFNLKFLLTSRPYGEIYHGFQPLGTSLSPMIHLSGESDEEIRKISKEIDIFINARVLDIGARLQLPKKEQDCLLQNLMRVPNRTYLWVHLTLDLVESKLGITQAGIADATFQLPKSVDEAYDRILSKSCNPQLAKKILHTVVAAARPLTLREMNFALAIRENHQSYQDVDLRPEKRFDKDIRDICGLFVTIIDSKIYLLHQTAKEFLLWDDRVNSPKGARRDLKWKYSLRLRESHRILTEICIWHLLFAEFETHPLDEYGPLSEYIEDHTFLDYSAKHWTAHLRELKIKTQDAMTPSILRICNASTRRCLTWFRIYWISTNTEFLQGFTTLMIASYFGLRTAVEQLLKMDGIDLNSRDDTYQRSALSWAAGNGFDVVAKLLVRGTSIGLGDFRLPFGKKAEVDLADRYGRTPLSYAIWNGNLAVVELLIGAGARADSKDVNGGTPLSYAFCAGRKELIKPLVKRGTQVDLGDNIINELLLSAAEKGDEEVVRLLLETDRVDPDAKDEQGWTPLSWATEGGHKTIVELLLKAGAKVDYEYLVEYPYERLLERYRFRTPLARAKEKGYEAIVKLLLGDG